MKHLRALLLVAACLLASAPAAASDGTIPIPGEGPTADGTIPIPGEEADSDSLAEDILDWLFGEGD